MPSVYRAKGHSPGAQSWSQSCLAGATSAVNLTYPAVSPGTDPINAK